MWNRARILAYHTVSAQPRPLPAAIDTPPSEFRRHMAWLRASHLPPLPLAPALETPAACSAVTFDDGYRDHYDEVLPVLREFGIPATIFVSTGYLDRDWETPNGPLPGLPRSLARELAASGLVGFGTHGHRHVDLTSLADRELEDELRRSKGELEELLGRPVETVSYPFGAHNARVRRATERAGYTWGLAVYTPHPGRYQVPRIPMARADGVVRLGLKTTAAYSALKRLVRGS